MVIDKLVINYWHVVYEYNRCFIPFSFLHEVHFFLRKDLMKFNKITSPGFFGISRYTSSIVI